MKIIKLSNGVPEEYTVELIAKLGCLVCPICGEVTQYSQFKKPKGVLSLGERKQYKFRYLFRSKYKTITTYRCCTCGAMWESDPY